MQHHRPRLGPVLIAIWAFLLFFIGFLGPALRQAAPPRPPGTPVVTSPITSILTIVGLVAFVVSIWAAVGVARLKRRPVLAALTLLVGYPLLLVGKALVTGYFSAWVARFLTFLIVVNGIALWYLLRPAVRQFWSSVGPASPAEPTA